MGVMHIPGHSHQAPREVALEEIEAVLGDCHLCQLYQSRHNIVFGVGNPRARVMFIGEAPGRNEDLQGEPFVGAAGEDLNGILSLAGLKREDVYIANVLKCRPPGNRNPRPEEVLACSPFLREQKYLARYHRDARQSRNALCAQDRDWHYQAARQVPSDGALCGDADVSSRGGAAQSGVAGVAGGRL
jgi:hypothetical protein